MQRHFHCLTFLLMLIANLSLLPDAMNPDPPTNALAPISPLPPPIRKEVLLKWQMKLNSFFGCGKEITNELLSGLSKRFHIKDVVVLKFDDVHYKLLRPELPPDVPRRGEMVGFEERMVVLKETMSNLNIKVHVLSMESKENKKIDEEILASNGNPKKSTLVIGVSGGHDGSRSIEILRKKFRSKWMVGLLDWTAKGELKLRKSRRRKWRLIFHSLFCHALVGSFPILTQEALSHFLVATKEKYANEKRALPIKKLRVIDFARFLLSNGVKALAFAFDRTITAGASLGAMPPEDVEGSEIGNEKIGVSWEEMEMVSEDFEYVYEVTRYRGILNCIVTFSDEEIKNQIMDSHEREEWLQHHYGESPPDMDFNELMKKTVAGEELVRRVLETTPVKPALIVAENPQYRPDLLKHKSSHLRKVRKAGHFHQAEVLLIDYEQASVLDARREGYPVLQVMGTKGFDLTNSVAPL